LTIGRDEELTGNPLIEAGASGQTGSIWGFATGTDSTLKKDATVGGETTITAIAQGVFINAR